MTRDQAIGCIVIANRDLYDVCKMLIKDELTRKRDRYNGPKLKRKYKLTDQDIYKLDDQDMLQMYKVCSCFGLCEMEMDWQVWMGALGDRWIGG